MRKEQSSYGEDADRMEASVREPLWKLAKVRCVSRRSLEHLVSAESRRLFSVETGTKGLPPGLG